MYASINNIESQLQQNTNKKNLDKFIQIQSFTTAQQQRNMT